MQTAVRSKTITQGLKYSLATGNWGANKTAGTRSGVSQVTRKAVGCQHFILILSILGA